MCKDKDQAKQSNITQSIMQTEGVALSIFK